MRRAFGNRLELGIVDDKGAPLEMTPATQASAPLLNTRPEILGNFSL